MTTQDCKNLIARFCRRNKDYMMKKWKQKPPPPSNSKYNESICKAKNWKRASKKKDKKNGNIIRIFHGCAGTWYDPKDAGWPRLLIATIIENGNKTEVKIRKY